MKPDIQKKIQHLFHRSGFGERYSVIESLNDTYIEKIVDGIFRKSDSFTDLKMESSYTLPSGKDPGQLTDKERKVLQKKSREEIREMNTKWIYKMANEDSFLREKMTLFWHGHFACRSRVSRFCINQNNTIRKHALGKFGDLLTAISKDPAMLQFLNNQQNRKSSPNENFARELMELFTLGIGNYTENDVKEAARAFTGWGFDKEGEFRFRKGAHDFGEKTFLGFSGKFSGEDIIRIILENKQTARFITAKIYKFFVNEEENVNITDKLSEGFYDSGYDVSLLMKRIFKSEEFYDEKNIGTRFKSPVELIAGLIKLLDLKFQNPSALMRLQSALGQVLFNPPNVGGWPGGKSWIDTSSLMLRMKMPEQLFMASKIEFDYKINIEEDDEAVTEMNEKRKLMQMRILNAEVNTHKLVSDFGKYNSNELVDKMCSYFLQVPAGRKKSKLIEEYADRTGKEDLIESVAMRIMSLPEFQLC